MWETWGDGEKKIMEIKYDNTHKYSSRNRYADTKFHACC